MSPTSYFLPFNCYSLTPNSSTMKQTIFSLTFLFLSATLLPAQDPSWHQVPAEDLLGNRGEIAKTIHSTQDEKILLDIWQRSEVDDDILYLKMLAAKRLGMYGTKAAVPVLVPRLDNERDGFFARYALETIPGAEVDTALGEALKTIRRPAAIAGILTTLGVRGNPDSAMVAKPFLTHEDIDVRRAAAYAYALTAGNSAIAFFMERKLNPLFADSGFLFAEQFEQKENKNQAGLIYNALRLADIKEYQKMAAIYHEILARGLKGVDFLVLQLKPDVPRRVFEVGLKAGRELPADAKATVARAMIGQLESQTDPLRKAKLVRAISDRQDKESKTTALPVIAELARPGDVAVRVVAIDALCNVGDVSVLPILIEATNQTAEKSVADAARNTLATLPGKEFDDAISGLLEGASPVVQVTAINLVEERRIFSAAPVLLKLLQNSNASVSEAAVSALGQISGIEDLPLLLDLLRRASSEAEAQKLLVVLKSACTRFAQDAAAMEVTKALDGASVVLKTQLLDLLKEIAGTKSLEIVNSFAWVEDAEMRNVATRILGEWRSPPDLDQLAVACLKLAKESKEYKVRGLRSYIRLARQFDMPEERRLSMCQEVFDLADRDEERTLIFDVFARIISVRSLEQTVSYLGNAALRERAAEAAVAIGEKLQGKDMKIADAMKKVLELSTNEAVKERAKRILDKQ